MVVFFPFCIYLSNSIDEPSAVNFNNNFKSQMDGNEHFYRMPPMSMAQSNSMSNMMMNMPPRGPPRFPGNNGQGKNILLLLSLPNEIQIWFFFWFRKPNASYEFWATTNVSDVPRTTSTIHEPISNRIVNTNGKQYQIFVYQNNEMISRTFYTLVGAMNER